MTKFIGRQVSVGVGVESTPGTAVAPTDWYKQIGLSFQRKATLIQNDSAMGRVERHNDSAIAEKWAEGAISGKISDVLIGYFLYQLFGSLSTEANADASGDVYDHTFTVANSVGAKYLTIVRKDPNSNRRYSLASFDEFEITWEAGQWVRFSGTLKSKPGATNTDNAAYTAEHEFTSKHVTIKRADTAAGLGAAVAIPVKSGRLTFTRPTELYFATGSIEPTDANTLAFEVGGELVLQYNNADIEDDWYADTAQALLIDFTNSDATIGTAANPSLVFTLPQVKFSTFDISDDLDGIVEQTVGFGAEFNTDDSAMITALLTNLQVSY